MTVRLALLFTLLAGLCTPLCAVTYTVTNTNDAGAGSLRDAMTQAAATPTIADDIVFNVTTPAVITCASRLPSVIGTLTITGPGARELTIQGTGPAPGYRCLETGASGTIGELTCTDISFRNFGWTTGGGGGCAFAWANLGTMTFRRCGFRECSGANTGAACITTNHIATIADCEFSNNVAVQGNGGAVSCGGTSTAITNCTFTNNSATISTGRGGAIVVTAGTVSIVSCTISGNTASSDGGGVARTGGTVTFTNTILAGNASTNTANEDGFSAAGGMVSQGFNLIQVTAGMNLTTLGTDLTGVDPQLSTLANNGGPTDTLALAATSPAIDAGSAGSLTGDQRGSARPVDDAAFANVADASDIGALELQAASAPAIFATRNFNPFATVGAAVPSGEQQFVVSGRNLSTAISVVPPAQFEVALVSGGPYSTSGVSTAAPSGGGDVAPTFIYVRYNPASAPPHSGNVVVSSTGAITQNVAVNGVLPSVFLSATDLTASESSATDRATLNIRISPPVNATLTIAYTMTGAASNTPGVDYTLSSATGTFSFVAGGGSITVPANTTLAAILLTAVDDTVDDGVAAEPAIMTIVGGTGYDPGSPATLTATITDNDPTVSITAIDNAAAESGAPPSDTGTYRITFSTTLTEALTLNFSRSGTATTSGTTDYSLAASVGTLSLSGTTGAIVLPVGTLTVDVTLSPTENTTAESSETAILTLTSGTGYTVVTPTNATVTIADNDGQPTVTVAATDNAAAEATPATDTGTYTITLSSAPTASIVINFTMSGTADPASGTDYTLSATGGTLAYTTGPAGTITVAAGITSVTLTLTTVDDALVEASEAATFTLAAGTGYTVGATASGQVTISDNDVTPSVSVSATDNTASEGAPATDTGVFTITLSPAPSAAVTLNFTMSGTASTVLTTDYDLAAAPGGVALAYTGPGGTLTVPAGVSSVTVTLTVVDDAAVEGAETATFTLNAGTGYTLGGSTSDTVSITDNDFPAASVASTDNTAAESTPATDTGTLIITLTPVAPTAGTTLNFTMSGTADTGAGVDYTLSATGGTLNYTGPTGTITVPAGISTVTLTLTVVDDSAIEGGTAETAVFTLNAGTGYTLGGSTVATVDITDNDVATTPTVTVAATDNAAAETTDTGTFTITLSPAPTSAVTVNFTMSGAADTGAGVDYTLTATGGTLTYTGPAGTFTVGAGVTSVTLTLTPIDDAAAEGATPEDATFTLNAGAGYTLGTSVSDTVDITDNDTPPTITVAATDNTAAEATPATNTGTFTLTLSPAPSATITLNFTMAGSAATGAGVDYNLGTAGATLTYTGPGGTLDVAAGVSSVTLTLTVVDDAAFEGAETATFTLNTGTGYTLGTPVSDTVNINDNDPPAPVTITTASLPGGSVGVAYSQPVNSTGGAAPYTWTLQSGTLPPGLALAASTTGSTTLSGTPTAAGAYNFTVQLADGSTADTQAFSVTIATTGGSVNRGGGDGSGCSTSEASSLLILAVFLALACLTRRLRCT